MTLHARRAWVTSMVGLLVICLGMAGRWLIWPIWLKSREPVRIDAPWPVTTDDASVALDTETPIIGMPFKLRARFSMANPRAGLCMLRLTKNIGAGPVIYHSQNEGSLTQSNQEAIFSAEVPIRDTMPPGTYKLEIRCGPTVVASSELQIIARPPHIPRMLRPQPVADAGETNAGVSWTVDEAVQSLLRGISERSLPEIEAGCHRVVLCHGEDMAIAALMKLLEEDESEWGLIFRAFAYLGAKAEPAVPVLIDGLGSRSLRAEACLALGAIGPGASPAVEPLKQLLENGELTNPVLTALRGIGPAAAPALPAMIDHLRIPSTDDNDDNYVPEVLKQAFAGIGVEAANALGNALVDADPSVRRRAAIVLEHMGPDSATALPALMASLEDPAVQDWSAAALGRIGPPAASAAPALARLLDRNDAALRICATRALGEIGPASQPFVPQLKKLLKDEYRVRVAAQVALKRIQTPNLSHSN